MPTINELNAVTQVSGSDLLPVFSQSNGDARKLSLTNFALWLQGQLTLNDDKVSQYAAPTTGSTVAVGDEQNSVWLMLTPAAGLSDLTLKMPLVSNTLDRQELLVNCTQSVTTLSFDANGSTLVGAPSSLSANGFFRLRFDAVMKTWYRVG